MPRHGAGWSRPSRREAEHLFRLLGSPMSVRALAGTAWNAWRKKGIGRRARHRRGCCLSSPRAWLDENFESAACARRRSPPGACISISRPTSPAARVFPYLESMANQSFGMVLGKGGADTIIRALTGMLTAAGGKIVTGAEVAEITMSGRQGDRRAARIGRDAYRDQGGHRRRRARARCRQAAAERLGRRRPSTRRCRNSATRRAR